MVKYVTYYEPVMLLYIVLIALVAVEAGARKEDYGQTLPQGKVNTPDSDISKPTHNVHKETNLPTPKVVSMTFLVTVNLTWGSCIETVKTLPLKPNQNWNETKAVVVGKCDKGPLTYKIISSDSASGGTIIEVTFYTTAIGIQPPSCRIVWDYAYIEPTTQSASESPLPGCFINDSQEGWHVTYYWLHILDWELDT